MLVTETEPGAQVYKVQCEDGSRHIVYNASFIGNPADHEPDKWYTRPYPVSLPLGCPVGRSYDSAQDAERAIRARHARMNLGLRTGPFQG